MTTPPELSQALGFVIKHRKKIAAGLYLVGQLVENLVPPAREIIATVPKLPCRKTPKKTSRRRQ